MKGFADNEEAASRSADPTDLFIEVERENHRLQRLLGELLLKNQQLRAELADQKKRYEAHLPGANNRRSLVSG